MAKIEKSHADCWRNLHDVNFRNCYSKTHIHNNIFRKISNEHLIQIVYISEGGFYD